MPFSLFQSPHSPLLQVHEIIMQEAISSDFVILWNSRDVHSIIVDVVILFYVSIWSLVRGVLFPICI